MDYDAVADLPLTVEGYDLTTCERDTSSGFVRTTTVVELHGDGNTGRGEDVTYETADHERFVAAFGAEGSDTLVPTGEFTVAEFSAALDDREFFPEPPEQEAARHYRRWGVESAALDLALRQRDTNLGALLDRSYDPVEFVASTRLGDPPTTDRVEALLAVHPDLGLKLDPTPDWTDAVIEALAATGAVRVLDLKGQYEGTTVDSPPDADLYERLIDAFPDAVLEDPGLTEETEPLFESAASERVSWDLPITGVASVEALPWEPRWLNVKPSRFGTVESLFETLALCAERSIRTYGGGQFELDVGRRQIQELAALCYPSAPNDVAPGAYNDPEVSPDLPAPPLSVGDDHVGFGTWA
jgi:hypothetical protein